MATAAPSSSARAHPGCEANSTISNESVAGPGVGTQVLVEEMLVLGWRRKWLYRTLLAVRRGSRIRKASGHLGLLHAAGPGLAESYRHEQRHHHGERQEPKNLDRLHGDRPREQPERSELGRGLDYFNNPQTRSFVFGLTLNRNR